MQYGHFPKTRLRRMRQSPQLRQLITGTQLQPSDFILPLFIHYGSNVANPIESMPGHYQISVDKLEYEVNEILKLGIGGVMLFGIPQHKDAYGSEGTSEEGVIPQAVKTIKQIAPELLVITDVCFCEYTDHGHCGILGTNNKIDNDKTLPGLAEQAVVHARAGTDMVAPSSMTDGMVKAIREGLDAEGYTELPILSYSVKYASSFYDPFREAAEGPPQFGDRRHHMLNPANREEAVHEAALDIHEGADMLMVKPGTPYMDVISLLKSQFPHMPLGAYHVSGEFAMIKAAGRQGWLDENKVAYEVLLGLKRAGADFILTYFAKSLAEYMSDK